MDISFTLPEQMKRKALICCILTGITGCATTGPQGLQPDKEDLVRLEAMTTIDAIREAENVYQEHRARDLDFLAPQHFDMAEKALHDAKELLTKNQPREKIVDKVAVAETVMRNGQLMARRIKSTLKDELELKQSLDSLNARDVDSGEYGSLVERLNQVIRQIENGQPQDLENSRQTLRKQMAELETKSLRHALLSEPEEILKRVKYRGGEKLAPMTYEEAVAVFNRAEEFILKNPHMKDAVRRMGNEALFAAKRALYITEEVAALSHKVSVSLEQVVLDEEYRINRIARSLGSTDVRDNPIEMQSELLAKTAEDLQAQYEKQEGLVVALRDTLIKVRDSAGFIAASNNMKQLKQEKGELLAKEALYAAKVSHLNTELETKDLTISQLQIQLQQAQQELALLETEIEQARVAQLAKPLETTAQVPDETLTPATAAVENTTESMAPAAEFAVVENHMPEQETSEQALQQEPLAQSETTTPVETVLPATASAPVTEPQTASAPAEETIAEQLDKVIEASTPAVAESKNEPSLEQTTSQLITDVLKSPEQEETVPVVAATESVAPVTRSPASIPAQNRQNARSLDKEDDLSLELEALAADR